MAKLKTQPTNRPDPVIDPPAATTRDTYRRLLAAGLTIREAGTLVARINGLGDVRGGWTIGEVERLLFVQELVRTGRVGS